MICGWDYLQGVYPSPSKNDVEQAGVLDYTEDEKNGDRSGRYQEHDLP